MQYEDENIVLCYNGELYSVDLEIWEEKKDNDEVNERLIGLIEDWD